MAAEISTYLTIASDANATLQFIELMGKAFHMGGIAGCKTEGQGKALALTCLCDGVTPLQFGRTYHIMDGKPTMRADAMLAAFMTGGGTWIWIDQGNDGQRAAARVAFGDNDMEVAYAIDDAKRAGLIKDKSAWQKDAGAMLRARLISKAIRMVAPHIIAGLYTPEEMGGGDIVDAEFETVPQAKLGKAAKPARAAEPVAPVAPPQPVAATAAPQATAPASPPAAQPTTAATAPAAEQSLQSRTEQLTAEAGDGGSIEFINEQLRSEIQDVQTRYGLTVWAHNRMITMRVDHINKLTIQQGRRLLVELYAKGLGAEGAMQQSLESRGLKSFDEATEEMVQKALDALRGMDAKKQAGN